MESKQDSDLLLRIFQLQLIKLKKAMKVSVHNSNGHRHPSITHTAHTSSYSPNETPSSFRIHCRRFTNRSYGPQALHRQMRKSLEAAHGSDHPKWLQTPILTIGAFGGQSVKFEIRNAQKYHTIEQGNLCGKCLISENNTQNQL